jgi:hypothetical protein
VSRLSVVIEKAQTKTPDWKEWNCGLFLADCLEAVAGVQIRHRFKIPHNTEKSARAAMKRFSGGGVYETGKKLAVELGVRECTPAQAGRGDPVIVSVDGSEAFGMVDLTGRRVMVVSQTKGLSFRPVEEIVHAWRII